MRIKIIINDKLTKDKAFCCTKLKMISEYDDDDDAEEMD